ncbi:hypothetical protein Pfo_014675 [Paulownia fortunei]|nr:hypothetical protein Pfo_014675 [Paulownia fortunei]
MSQEEEPASPGARLMQAPFFNISILAVTGFMTTIDVSLFKKELEQTLIKHPRFSSVLIVNNRKRGEFSWKRTRVDVENHIFSPDLDPNMESPNEFVEDFTSFISKNSMDMTKPLWEVYILNVKTSDAKSTVIFKVHHSIGDGVSLISLVLACAKKISDPESLPVIPSKKQKLIADNGLMKRLFFLVWTLFLIIFNTLIGCIWILATILFLKDTETPIKGARGIELSPKRFVHRIIDFDDIKLAKTAMNVSINDVALGVAEAGLSRYLNMRYVMNDLSPLPPQKNIERMMQKSSRTLIFYPKIFALDRLFLLTSGIVLLPLNIALQDDPLSYIRRAKATMDRKKLSLESKCVSMVLMLLIKLFGITPAAAMTSGVFWNTTLAFSNVVGPKEEITLFGHPLSYIAPTLSGFPQALVIHFQSYADKFIISVAADEKLIPNPHQLCDDMQKSLEDIKDTVIKRGLVNGS